MKNRLEISQHPSQVTQKDFQRWFIRQTEKAFKVSKSRGMDQFPPLACMLVQGAILMINIDLGDDQAKREAMQQMRTLARIVGCRAYGFVSEVYFKEFAAEEREGAEQLIDAVDGKASMMSGRKEVLFCSIEIKNGKKSQVIWDIENNQLGPAKPMLVPDSDDDDVKVSGRMTNIL